jgi:hypothetical protein
MAMFSSLFHIRVFRLIVLALAVVAAPSFARAAAGPAYTFQTLDDPDAGLMYYRVTQISDFSGGNIAGSFQSLNGEYHGFVFNVATQTNVAIDHPDANMDTGDGENQVGTFVTGISDGTVVGYYTDKQGRYHGFLHNLSTPAVYVALDGPGRRGGSAYSISGGNVVGFYYDSQDNTHGFLYNIKTKAYTTVDIPGRVDTVIYGFSGGNIVATCSGGSYLYDLTTQVSTRLAFSGAVATQVRAIEGGNIVGYYNDDQGLSHGFLYDIAAQTYTTLDAPDASPGPDDFPPVGTLANGISGGNIVGIAYFVDSEGSVGVPSAHGFIYNQLSQAYTRFDLPAGRQPTRVTGISGTSVVGYYTVGHFVDDLQQSARPFLYSIAARTFTSFAIEGATSITPFGISNGNVVGVYFDGNRTQHSFLYNLTDQSTRVFDDLDSNYSGVTPFGIDGANIVGVYNDEGNSRRGFLYDLTTQAFTTLNDTFDNATDTYAHGISGGNIVGMCIRLNGGPFHGYIYNIATQIYTTLDVPFAGAVATMAWGIDGSNIVGLYNGQSVTGHGFLYHLATNKFTPFDYPLGKNGSVAYGISGGYIVGGFGTDYLSSSQASYLATSNSILTAPNITTPPANLTVLAPASANFTVSATGTPVLKYQWYLDGKKIPGAVKSTYRIARTTAASAGNYTVVVSDSAGNVTSAPAILTVTAPPKIVAQSRQVSINSGANGALSVSATGTSPLAYLWHQNNVPITAVNVSGITGPLLSIVSANTANIGTYTVTVSNNFGSVTSQPIKVTVKAPKP